MSAWRAPIPAALRDAASSGGQPRPRLSAGLEYEAKARAHLESQGLIWVASNHRCRFGELDLIMRDHQVLAFIEVRFRRSRRFGGAAVSVDVHKRRRLIAAARHYLSRHPTDSACRFDVVAIEGDEQIRWIKGAFDVSAQ